MPKAIVLEPLVIVIPGEYMDRSEEEIQKVLQYALTDLAR